MTMKHSKVLFIFLQQILNSELKIKAVKLIELGGGGGCLKPSCFLAIEMQIALRGLVSQTSLSP